MTYYDLSLEKERETIAHRRYLHAHAEAGLHTPQTMNYISSELKRLGLSPISCGCGTVCEIGSGDVCVMLRADADALPITEKSSEAFKSLSDAAAHCCGHDVHSAMLLGAATLLAERSSDLRGRVVLMFQAGEELLLGCRDMIANGLLSRFAPSAAFALHTAAGKIEPGVYMYNAGGVMMRSADCFELDIYGKGGHASYGTAADPIRAACRIYELISALPTLCGTQTNVSVTVGCLSAGNAANVIPDHARICGSIRCNKEALRSSMREALERGAAHTAQKSGCRAELHFTASVPTLVCDRELTVLAREAIKSCGVKWRGETDGISVSASDDFALIAERVPSVYVYLSSGFSDERGEHTAHNARVRFNEDVCAMGSAVYAALAENYLLYRCEKKP